MRLHDHCGQILTRCRAEHPQSRTQGMDVKYFGEGCTPLSRAAIPGMMAALSPDRLPGEHQGNAGPESVSTKLKKALGTVGVPYKCSRY